MYARLQATVYLIIYTITVSFPLLVEIIIITNICEELFFSNYFKLCICSKSKEKHYVKHKN